MAAPELSDIYAALADETRRGIVARLVHGDASVAELRAPLAMSAPAVSKHLRVLEAAGLIERRRAGRHQLCRLRGEPLHHAQAWLGDQVAFWSATLDSLVAHLESHR
ncbi:MAG: ArsR/SmtB family transcription factor [Acidimicrobiales bacterium]